MRSKSNPGRSSNPGRRRRRLRKAAAAGLGPLRGPLKRLAARRRMWRRVAQGLGAVAIVAALLLGGAVYRLSQGPVSMSFLTPRITAAVQQQLPPGFVARIGDTVLEQEGESGNVLLRLHNIEVLGPGGAPLFASPRAAIGLSGIGLLTGNVTPTTVSLLRPHVTLIEENGRIRLQTGIPAAGGREEVAVRKANPVEVFAVLLAVLGQSEGKVGQGLTAIGARNARLTISREDGTSGSLEGVDLHARRGADPGAVDLTLGLGRQAGSPLLKGALQRRYDGSYGIAVSLENVTVTDFAPLIPGGLPFDATNPVSGTINASVDADGGFDRLSADVVVGAGYVGIGKKTVLVDEANLAFDWSYRTGAITIRPSHILVGESHGTVSGLISVPARGDFSYGTVPIRLEFSDIAFEDHLAGVPAQYDSASLEAFFVTSQNILHISRFDVTGAGTAGSFVGFIGGEGETPGVKLAGSLTPTSVEAFKSVWPPFVADKARKWFVNNMISGDIIGGRVNVDIEPGEIARKIRGVPFHREAFDLGFTLQDASFRFLKRMPPIVGVNATGTVDAQEFLAKATTPSRIELPDGGVIQVPTGQFFVPDIPAKPSTGETTVTLDGDVKTLLTLLDYPPVELAKRRNMNIADFSGEGEFEFNLRMPLIEGLRFSDVDLDIDGDIDEFSASNFAGAKSIRDGNIDVDVADGRVLISGDALVDNVRADLSLEDSVDGSGAPGERSVTMTLDEDARARLGMPMDSLLSGPIVVTVSDVKATETGNTQSIEADLTQASIDFPALGLEKAVGQPGKATLDLTQSGDRVTLSNLRVQAETLRVEGGAEFAKGGGLIRLNLPVVRTPRGTDVSVSATTQGGVQSFKLAGKTLDMRALLKELGDVAGASGESGSGPTINVDIDLERAIGTGGVELSNMQGTMRRTGARTDSLVLSAATSNGAPVTIRYSDNGTDADVAIDSSDGGRVLAWAGYYANMRDGQMRLVASRRGAQAPLAGDISINRFRIANDPSLARLIEGGEEQAGASAPSRAATSRATTPQRSGATQLNASDVGFDSLSAKFQRGKGDLKVSEGVLRGVAVGATFEGAINFESKQLNLHGTYVPLYALNNLFGQLPLFLGPLLGGKKNEGLLGITYSLSGSTDKPILTINPISVVAPGVFRYILGMDNPRAPTRTGVQPQTGTVNR